MEVEVKIKDLLNPTLEMNSAASTLFEEINNLHEERIKINFENIIFMSRSFAQKYVYHKNNTKKAIEEINLPDNVAPILEIIENSFKRDVKA